MSAIRAAVITISDSSYRGEREDASGPAVCQALAANNIDAGLLPVLPDEIDAIAACLAEVADGGNFHAIFTTGGTGIALRDVTPEATRKVIDREIPGLGELMRMRGLEKTRFAVLSRSMGGTRGRALIVNLPGSPKGAVESLDAIVNLVPHMVALLNGDTGHPPEPKRGQQA